ncbi:MAG: methyltransferase domain-containing protein [bacterium]
MRPGQSFGNADVVDNYRFRPEYPAEIYEKLVALAPTHTHALDLGCGTGKIARGISPSFESVTVIDASEVMIGVAKRLDTHNSSNINWVQRYLNSTPTCFTCSSHMRLTAS